MDINIYSWAIPVRSLFFLFKVFISIFLNLRIHANDKNVPNETHFIIIVFIVNS